LLESPAVDLTTRVGQKTGKGSKRVKIDQRKEEWKRAVKWTRKCLQQSWEIETWLLASCSRSTYGYINTHGAIITHKNYS